MRYPGLAAAAAAMLVAFPASAAAEGLDAAAIHLAALTQSDFDPFNRVIARIDLSEQTMYVYVENRLAYVWPVSTGLGSYWTPTGQWHPFFLSRHHRSSLYDDAPMPFAVFFNGNIAVHGTTAVSQLGRPASHGCVRLDPANAEVFFNLVQERGMGATTIAVVN